MGVENFSQEKIKSIVAAQREYFASGATLSYEFRRKQLKILLLAPLGQEKTLKKDKKQRLRMNLKKEWLVAGEQGFLVAEILN